MRRGAMTWSILFFVSMFLSAQFNARMHGTRPDPGDLNQILRDAGRSPWLVRCANSSAANNSA
jgi:hypothetical protein